MNKPLEFVFVVVATVVVAVPPKRLPFVEVLVLPPSSAFFINTVALCLCTFNQLLQSDTGLALYSICAIRSIMIVRLMPSGIGVLLSFCFPLWLFGNGDSVLSEVFVVDTAGVVDVDVVATDVVATDVVATDVVLPKLMVDVDCDEGLLRLVDGC